MAPPTVSKLGKRQVIGPALTPSQIEIILKARVAGYSKQQVLTKGLPLLTEADLPPHEPHGAGRKTVQVRIAPEVLEQMKSTCARFGTTQGRVMTGCATALLRGRT